MNIYVSDEGLHNVTLELTSLEEVVTMITHLNCGGDTLDAGIPLSILGHDGENRDKIKSMIRRVDTSMWHEFVNIVNRNKLRELVEAYQLDTH